MRALDDHIQHIMETYNWSLVLSVMESLDWKWPDVGGIPKEQDLKDKVIKLMTGVSGLHGRTLGSGGFYVTYYKINDDLDNFRVHFSVCTRDTGMNLI